MRAKVRLRDKIVVSHTLLRCSTAKFPAILTDYSPAEASLPCSCFPSVVEFVQPFPLLTVWSAVTVSHVLMELMVY